MQACLPGKPQSEFHAVDAALWDGRRIVAYVSGNTLVLLRGPHQYLQTITHAEHDVLRAVAIDSATGKIATTNGSEVYVHRPLQDFGQLRWSLQNTYSPTDVEDIACLSWGLPGEVLVGGSKLVLLEANDDFREYWKSPRLANSCKLASFSHDASLVASTGWHDRLVKIWRRGFIGGGNERFDPVYLSHPGTVTLLKWRGRPRTEEHADVVLYTTCTDGYLRVWTVQEAHCLHILDLWTELDLVSCIQPRSPLSPSPFKKRYAFIVDRWDFQQAVEDAAHQKTGGEREQHTREHLREIASNEPEVCIVLDDAGNMSAWGLERIGCKTRFGRGYMNIGHAEDLGIDFPEGLADTEDFAVFRGFAGPQGEASLHILAHFFDGRLQWLASRIERLFDPSPQPKTVRLMSELTGHSDTVQRLIADESGHSITSQAESGEIIAWAQPVQGGSSLVRRSLLMPKAKVSDIRILQSGQYAVLLEEGALSCWDLRRLKALRVAVLPLKVEPGSQLGVPSEDEKGQAYVSVFGPALNEQCVAVSIQHDGVKMKRVSELRLDGGKPLTNGEVNGVRHDQDETSTEYDLHPISANLVAASDAAGSLTVFESRGLHPSDGDHRSLRARTSFGAEQKKVVGCSSTHAAVLDNQGTELTVWNTVSGHCELTHHFPTHDPAMTVRWYTTRSGQAAFAVVLSHRLAVFIQSRFDSLQRSPAWIQIKDISILELTTLPIADVAWTAGDGLVVAAGSQLFGFGTKSSPPDDNLQLITQAPAKKQRNVKLNDLALTTNATLPTFHGLSLSSQILSGNVLDVQRLLFSLHEHLKFWTEDDELASGFTFETSHEDSQPHTTGYVNGGSHDKDTDTTQDPKFDSNTAEALQERLQTLTLPYLSQTNQTHLSAITHTLGAISPHQNSVDTFGLVYLASLHLSSSPSPMPPNPYRTAVLALLSDSQDILLSQTLQHQAPGGSFPWTHARGNLTPLWLSSRDTLLQHFESIARAEYTKSPDRNPLHCSLFYLALRKKAVLQGLWRMAHGHKERESTMRILSHDFTEKRWKSAALKNAYALLGKRRSGYAAAWFLLAGEGESAVNVLAGEEVNDLELAISVARVFDGDGGGVLRGVVEDKLLPRAVAEGDRWKAVYGFLMLRREDLALRAIVRPLAEVVPGCGKIEVPLESRMWHKEDPSMLWVYRHLRDNWFSSAKTRNTPFPVTVREEKEAVKGAARMYVRMGLGWLAVGLMRGWEFTRPAQSSVVAAVNGAERAAGEQKDEQGAETLPPSMLDGFETPESKPPASAPSEPVQDQFQGRKKVTEEPSAASILDSFDF